MQQRTKLNTSDLKAYFETHPYGKQIFQSLDDDWRERFILYCEGKKTLPLTYDPFFKRIFHPDIHPDRLSRFISCLLGIKVTVRGVLPTEDLIISNDTMMIMDILVELEDESLANIEIQKVPYTFPAERLSCYSCDLVLRQYSRVKGIRGKQFTYKDIKTVYTIVIYEKSISVFHDAAPEYIHHGENIFDTGLKLNLLQKHCLVALDVYRKSKYSKGIEEINAWIGLLATENVSDAEELISRFPFLREIYDEMDEFMQNIEEVLLMYSEALKILDRNSMHYMVDEMQKEIDEKDAVIEEKDAEIAALKSQLQQINKKE